MLNATDYNFLTTCLPFVEKMSKADISLIISNSTKIFHQKSKIIMDSSNKCMGLILVKSGQLRAYLHTDSGKELTLYRLMSGDVCILTASCILNNIDFDVTMQTEKPSGVIVIPANLWANLSSTYTQAKEFSMNLLNNRFSSVMWVIEQMVSKNMDERVSHFLYEQSELEKSTTLTITHEEIANNLGSAREVISRILKYLENECLIKLSRGKIKLIDIDKLKYY